MKPLVISLTLAIALMATQTAVAIHDIHCLDGDHEQICEIYFTQDHSASAEGGDSPSISAFFGANSFAFAALNSPRIFQSFYFSRAPPHLF